MCGISSLVTAMVTGWCSRAWPSADSWWRWIPWIRQPHPPTWFSGTWTVAGTSRPPGGRCFRHFLNGPTACDARTDEVDMHSRYVGLIAALMMWLAVPASARDAPQRVTGDGITGHVERHGDFPSRHVPARN